MRILLSPWATAPVTVTPPPNRHAVGRGVALAALLIFTGIAVGEWKPYTFLHGDGAFYANINKSVWHDLSLDQTRYHPHSWLEEDLGWNRNLDQGWSNVSLGKDGRWLPKHSWVMPLAATPLYAVFGLAGLLVFNVLMLTVLVASAYLIASRYLHPAYSAVAALLVSAQPIIAGDTYSYNNDVFYSACLLAGTASFLAAIGAGEARAPEGRRRRRLEIAAGLLMGIGVWAKITNLVFVLPFGLWLLSRGERISLKRVAIAFAVPMGIFLASNATLFGSPFSTSYSKILVRKDGALATESISERFKEPLREGLVRVITDDGQGLKGKAPLLAVAAVGAVLLLFNAATRAPAAAFLAILAAFLGVQAKYGFTYARFFLPVAGLSVLPIGGVLALLSALVPKLARIFQPKLEERWNPAFVCLIISVVAVLLVVRWRYNPAKSPAYRLVDHVEDARVTTESGHVPIGKGRRCDYFNNMHQKFECPGDKGGGEMWGRAVGEECSFGGNPERLLFLHPPRSAGARTIAFDLPPGDRLRFRYGLADSSKADDIAFEVQLGGVTLPLVPVAKRGKLVNHEVSGLSVLSSPLTITVRNPPVDWRHFCFDAVVVE